VKQIIISYAIILAIGSEENSVAFYVNKHAFVEH